MYEGIYLIQEREFIKSGEEVYTIGRSHSINERIKQYPKQSNLFLIVLCKKSIEIEKELIKILTKKFILCSCYGAEYFEGKLDEIILEIEIYFKNIKSLFCKIKNSSTNNFNFKCITNDNTNEINNDIINKVIYPIKINKDENTIIKSQIHINHVDEFINNNKITHTCKYCNFKTIHKGDYDKHLLTKKHKKNYNNKKSELTNTSITILDYNKKLDKVIKENKETLKIIKQIINKNTLKCNK